jgi:hypothetical protein
MVHAVTKQKRSTKADANSAQDVTTKNLRFLYPVLLGCELDREVDDSEEEKEPERFYYATIRPVNISDGLNVALCEFSAGEKIGEKETLKFNALYYVAFETSNTQPSNAIFRKLIQQIAIVSAWPLFRSLFSQMVSQANEDLPALPAEPEFQWLKKLENPEMKTADSI